MRMGGLGLSFARRCAVAAHWASDALPMIHERTPAVAIDVQRALEEQIPQAGCMAELHEARAAGSGRVLVEAKLAGAPRRQATTCTNYRRAG